jgi:riboflavin kinase/FMN adenylyltransferase
MTLHPHPVKLLRPSVAPRLLTTLEQRLGLIARTGVDLALVLPFTHRLARMEAESFVRSVLVDRLAVREVYIGANFRFGADRGGDVDLLVRMGGELGFGASAWPTVVVDGAPVSSTRVRETVAAGGVEEASALLGRAVFVDGRVVVGRQMGRGLGFPTLNLATDNELLPARGVYVTATEVDGIEGTFGSVTNVGVRPTVTDGGFETVETHLFGFDADAYGHRARVHFLCRIRDERSFPSVEVLREQIGRDVASARAALEAEPAADRRLIPLR